MRQFFKFTLASILGNLLATLLFLGFSFGGLVFLIVAIASSSEDSEPTLEDKSVLVFDLGLEIRDTEPESTTGEEINQVLSGTDQRTISLRTVVNSLEKAASDDKIVGLYLDGSQSFSDNGLANLREVRQALEKFRESGKPIYAYDASWTEQEYYLGSVATQTILNPMGGMELNGFSSQMMFLGGAFRKYGIDMQVVRAGKYKSAVEPLVLTKLSPENRQQMQKLLNDLWGEFVATAGRHRQLSPQQLQAIADNRGILLAQEAKQLGLIDRIAYADDVIAELKKLTENSEEDRTFNQVSLNKYAQINSPTLSLEGQDQQVAVIYAEGEIVDGEGGVGQIGGDRFAALIRKLRFDQDVKAVVVRVNSPGGSATASDIIGREIALTREAKPVIISMGNYAASGGYWIAVEGDRIFAEPTTITGSIGVFGILPNIQKLANNNGITWDTVKTGRYADLDTVARPKTPQELAVFQNAVNRIYQLFINRVATARKLPAQKVAELAQGRVWSGVEAKNLGLVDELGGLNGAIAFAAKQAELGDDFQVEEYPKVRTLEDRLLEQFSGQESLEPAVKQDLITREFRKFQQELALLQTFNDPLGVYTRLPFNFQID